ncbi:plasmid mobilization relaxosome protein MobC [Paludicola sp. MB14-C6]|uniref:plasmid mobilization protein n=1 Tax=Paludihabitans sp. MB14-C6 TaxID=3070656 RepID=UPI0027DCA8F4|nr:plasmid mobilization relaxosome protein MobC [Paludicola sp. MB14-C6]WMJ22889.1 plasmid mobilization relaxosome protein MobC [Paludicola sp. MB14-C6]
MKRYSFVIRLTEDEMIQLNAKVKQTGLSREAYIRLLLQNKVPVTIPPDIFYKVHNELCRIGNNLNQLANRAHVLQMIDVPSYRDNTNRLYDICFKLIEATIPRMSDA